MCLQAPLAAHMRPHHGIHDDAAAACPAGAGLQHAFRQLWTALAGAAGPSVPAMLNRSLMKRHFVCLWLMRGHSLLQDLPCSSCRCYCWLGAAAAAATAQLRRSRNNVMCILVLI